MKINVTSAAYFNPGSGLSESTNGVLERRMISRNLIVKFVGRLNIKYVSASLPWTGKEPLNNLLNPLPI